MPPAALFTLPHDQVDSFNKALQRNTTTGKLTALFKTKMLSRTNTGCSSPQSARSPNGSQGGTGSCLSADEMLQWSNVSISDSRPGPVQHC